MPAPVNRETEFPATRNLKEGENYHVSYYCAVVSKIPVRINLSKEFMPALNFYMIKNHCVGVGVVCGSRSVTCCSHHGRAGKGIVRLEVGLAHDLQRPLVTLFWEVRPHLLRAPQPVRSAWLTKWQAFKTPGSSHNC